MKSKIILTVLAIFWLALAAMLRFALAPKLTMRIPPGWSWKSEMVGTQTYTDSTGAFPDNPGTSNYYRSISIADETKRPDSVLLKDEYTVFDPTTKKILWQYVYTAWVDPQTGKHLAPEYKNDCCVFPRDAQKQTYTFRTNYIKGIPLRFAREEILFDLPTYVYAYSGAAEYTESYLGSPEYPGVSVARGQEIRCSEDQFQLQLYVEPLTGEIVKVSESCHSGDYLFDKATGKPRMAILRWGGESDGKDVTLRIEHIRSVRSGILWQSTYAPLALCALAVILLIVAFRKQKPKQSEEE